MKKSTKKFLVNVDMNGSVTPNDVGTRSGVANLVRQILENVKGGDTIVLNIKVEDVVDTTSTE